MNRPVEVATRPKLALQSYLDALLYDATEVLEEPVSSIDEFQAAVLEEQAFDARMQAQIKPLAVAVAAPAPVAVAVKVAAPAPVIEVAPVIVAEVVKVEEAVSTVELVEPVAELSTLVTQRTPTPPPTSDGRPAWAAEPFECLLFDVAGLTLAVPLVCLGSIYPLAGQELTPLFGQPDWFLGILPCQAGNLKVLDTARWIMPDRYRDDFRQGLQYVISVQGYEWGLAVHQVSRSLRLDPNEIKWRTQRGQRPWLAGTVIEHMCALLDVAELAELIASGAVKQLNKSK
ncbi:CheW domain-containing protein [Pseudomonas syringae group sp. 26L6]|nr:CheW domain-containing protein [Pseudomonas syringae group sp. 26L6]MDU8648324.1 CheW domain-containing protein [Pseudomonas syringae group sp. 26L6]